MFSPKASRILVRTGWLAAACIGWLAGGGHGYGAVPAPPIRTSEITDYLLLLPRTGYAADTAACTGFLTANAPTLRTHAAAPEQVWLRNKAALHVYYLFFSLQNDQPDTARFYLDAESVESLRVRDVTGPPHELPTGIYPGSVEVNTPTVLLSVPPGRTNRYAVRIAPDKTKNSLLFVALSRPHDAVNDFLQGYRTIFNTVFFLGMLSMMLLYISFKYLQTGSHDYLYYTGYIFCFLLYFLLKFDLVGLVPANQSPFVKYFLLNALQVCAYCCYFGFFARFLNVRQTIPRLHRYLRGAAWVLLAYVLLDFVLFFFPAAYPVRWLAWDVLRVVIVGFSLSIIVAIVHYPNPLMRYLLGGSLAMTLFGLAAMWLTYRPELIEGWPVPLSIPLFYFEAGIGIELLCFSLGLGYKNHRDELEKIQANQELAYERTRREFDTYRAAVEAREAERRRIAAEMHDDLGSGLTSILFLSNAAHRHAANGQAEATAKITQMASQLMDQMNNIIWSLDTACDSLDEFIAYTRSHVSELLDNAGLDYRFTVPDAVPPVPLNGGQRRNLYLAVKEAVHNAIKHAHGTQVHVRFEWTGTELAISVTDDGCGLPAQEGRMGNGLRNMGQRMHALNGTFGRQGGPGGGTTVRLCVPLDTQPAASP